MFNLKNANEAIEKVRFIIADEVTNFMGKSMTLRSALLNFFKETNKDLLIQLIRLTIINENVVAA
jgi:hypothetical protein